MSYNMTFADNITNVYQTFFGVNDASGSVPAIFTLIIIFIALYATLQHSGTIKAWIASSFVTAMIAGMFWLINLVGWYVAVVPLIFLIGGIIGKAAMGE